MHAHAYVLAHATRASSVRIADRDAILPASFQFLAMRSFIQEAQKRKELFPFVPDLRELTHTHTLLYLHVTHALLSLVTRDPCRLLWKDFAAPALTWPAPGSTHTSSTTKKRHGADKSRRSLLIPVHEHVRPASSASSRIGSSSVSLGGQSDHWKASRNIYHVARDGAPVQRVHKSKTASKPSQSGSTSRTKTSEGERAGGEGSKLLNNSRRNCEIVRRRPNRVEDRRRLMSPSESTGEFSDFKSQPDARVRSEMVYESDARSGYLICYVYYISAVS